MIEIVRDFLEQAMGIMAWSTATTNLTLIYKHTEDRLGTLKVLSNFPVRDIYEQPQRKMILLHNLVNQSKGKITSP